MMLRFLLLPSAVAVAVSLASVEDSVAEGTLVMDDACLSGEECGLSLRQLRLETSQQERAALSMSEMVEFQHASSMQAAMGHRTDSSRQFALSSADPSGATISSGAGVHRVLGLKHCYPVLARMSLMYTCEDEVFTQKAYLSGDCADPEVNKLGGKSPYEAKVPTTWTCHEDPKVCASAKDVSNATSCAEQTEEPEEGEETESESSVFAVGHCYPLGFFSSRRFTCDNGVFRQTSYGNGDCTSDTEFKLGGPSPWQFPETIWTCSQDAEVCAAAWKDPNATSCVKADQGPLCDHC